MIRPKHCKTQRKARIHLRAPLPLLFFLTFALALDGTGIVRIGLLCALLHEGGHLFLYYRLWHRWPDLELSPFGICLLQRGLSMTPQQEFLLAAAGPLANLLCCCAVLGWMQMTHYSYAGYWFASTNLLVGVCQPSAFARAGRSKTAAFFLALDVNGCISASHGVQ